MLSLKPRLRSALLLSLSGISTLSSCAGTPPDTLGCAPYVAAEWANYQAEFNTLCAEDPACAPNLAVWQARTASWAPPTDSGTCVAWLSRNIYDVDATHPLPAAVSGTGADQSWAVLGSTGVLLPAAASAAPLETYIQSNCHDNSQCGAVGDWQGTIQATNKTLTTQSAKVSALARAKKGSTK